MKRRDFITLLGGAAAAWPLAARAQQSERLRRIGVLMAYAENDAEGQANVAAFRKELQKLGWTEGRNIRIDTRWATADFESIQQFAKDLVALQPELVLSSSNAVSDPQATGSNVEEILMNRGLTPAHLPRRVRATGPQSNRSTPL
jgi:ABC-type uncharacterized transport system substrate-binding protein